METFYKVVGIGGIIFAAMTYGWMPWWGTSSAVALGLWGFYLARDERRASGGNSSGWEWSDLDLFDWFSLDTSADSDSSDSGDWGDSGGDGDCGGSDD